MGKKKADSSKAGKNKLDLGILAQGLPAVTPAFGLACAEAGSVCLDTQGHSGSVTMEVGGSYTNGYQLHWAGVSAQVKRCWNDLQVATEHGAYGIAFLLIRSLTTYTVIERARKGPGFDYWLGKDDQLFQKKARLEISGILCGTEAQVKSRIKEKFDQIKPSNKSKLAGFIVVVEFNRPMAKVVKK